jgi:hypothetical protein
MKPGAKKTHADAAKRRSPSSDASRADQIERDRRLSPLERVDVALALGRRSQEIAVLFARASGSAK